MSGGRLDHEMVKRGIIKSRENAKELILAEKVNVNSKICKKPSALIAEDDIIEITGEILKYVSRGGLKLEKIINKYKIDLNEQTCIDIGASTGGFTDCMLQNGAKTVYAVDVGTGQLAEKLQNDKRVINMEKTDIRNLTEDDFDVKADFISIDVSFISVKFILPKAFCLLNDSGSITALIKPQFEAGRDNIGKNGIVKSKTVHINILKDICSFIENLGYNISDLCYSPVTGIKGNIEYLILISNKYQNDIKVLDYIEIVEEAFNKFRKRGK